MNINQLKASLLSAGDVQGLIEINRQNFGSATMMARGYHAVADVLTKTADGRDLNEVWREFQQTIAIQNSARQRIIDLLTFSVTNVIEDVPQFSTDGGFEVASEFGVPQSDRPTANVLSLGYGFTWYDRAIRYTWQYLAEATAAQVEADHQAILEADNQNVFKRVMETVFRSTNKTANIKGQNYNVYTFWNADGTVPPAYKSNTFSGTHNHFRTSGAATVTPGDLDEIIDDFKSHGYGAENGTTMFMLVNSTEANVIRTFRFANGARYDFIPAQGQPGLLLPVGSGGDLQVLGQGQAPSTFRGMNVVGSYGPLLIIEEEYVPPAYMVALVSGGQSNIQNPIGIREHANAGLRGLRLVKGRDNDYPLIDSYYTRGFGTGVRQRGAGLVMQITANASYTAPAQYAS